MKPFFCRIGGKNLMRNQIIPLIPNHKVYVEPFVGGGAIYWNKKPAELEVISDIDKALIDGYNDIKSANTTLSEYPEDLNTIEKLTQFLHKPNKTKEEKLTEKLIIANNGYSSHPVRKTLVIYASTNPHTKTQKIDEYKQRMKNTIIKNQDYKQVIDDYDSEDTVFYLDPPYVANDKHENNKMYKNNKMDFEELSNILSNIKGKFLLSINEHPVITGLFKKFKTRKLKLTTNAGTTSRIGRKPRVELLITNF